MSSRNEIRSDGAVKHPDREQWMAYLYGELARTPRSELQDHLSACPECRASVGDWRKAMQGLGAWKLDGEAKGLRPVLRSPPLKWAIAAVAVLGLGVGIGRISAPGPDVNAIRAAIEKPLRASLVAEVKQQVQDELRADWQAAMAGEPLDTEFRRHLHSGMQQWSAQTLAAARTQSQHLLEPFAEEYAANRQQEQQATAELFRQTERQRQADYVNLRRAVETVAVVAADKFQRTETELGQLALGRQDGGEAQQASP